MAKNIRSSSGDGRHPYMKGFRFWSQNQFWNTGMYSEKAKEYYQKSLERMLSKDRVLARLDETII